MAPATQHNQFEAMRAAEPQAPQPADDAPHVLLIDDDRRIRELLGQYLRENGYRVTTADCAAKAEARMRGLAFDLLILDVMMPGQSGLELRRRSDATPTYRY